jgi:uncharacterized protein YabN with tetrapyrrole methylase and pyrophosphatase domain
VQLTPEARDEIVHAERLLFLVAEPIAAEQLLRLNASARSLHELYREGAPRAEAYEAMVEQIVASAREGLRACAAFYGHPGIFGTPAHESVRRARQEGIDARMLPGVSAEDCLFADLGIDPGRDGCQSYEATRFLEQRRPVDTRAVLVLWQATVLGRLDYTPEPDTRALPQLVERLRESYPAGHEVVVYAASPYPVGPAVIRRVRLDELTGAQLPRLATLVVPPLS